MLINREHVRNIFDKYTAGYDLTDPKIRLKAEHTFYVASNCERIAASLSLPAQDVDLAWLLGMFHDIGRFEQIRRYHTFQDRDSVDHAALSADILFQDGLLYDFLPDAADEPDLHMAEKAVRLHNVYRLPDSLTERESLFARILRDADRIDILRVNCETPREEIYNLPTEAFVTSRISDSVFDDLMHHRMVDRTGSRTGIDFILGHVGFVFGLEFEESRVLTREQGYLYRLLAFESRLPETNEKLQMVKEAVDEVLKGGMQV